MLLPVPAAVPPQLPLYHCQLAAVPRLPPLMVRVAEAPAHKVDAVALIDAGAVEGVFILMVTLEQAVVLQVPSALT